ncbi:hypothetical protein PR048_016358 [Dryococelus australis]|uniref:Uncharacterized protein n=1 Tax=Dryococelus australis TaxID=614101 RepID=A0ABQ9HJI5_9NEOP|nr:hypothetical protein PR048_016358 [Dryococelus australis]
MVQLFCEDYYYAMKWGSVAIDALENFGPILTHPPHIDVALTAPLRRQTSAALLLHRARMGHQSFMQKPGQGTGSPTAWPQVITSCSITVNKRISLPPDIDKDASLRHPWLYEQHCIMDHGNFKVYLGDERRVTLTWEYPTE